MCLDSMVSRNSTRALHYAAPWKQRCCFDRVEILQAPSPLPLPTSSPLLVHHVPWTVRDILRSLIECYLWAQKTFSFVFSSFFP